MNEERGILNDAPLSSCALRPSEFFARTRMSHTKYSPLRWVLVGVVVFTLAGCEDKKDLEEIRITQQVILNRLEKLEKGLEAITPVGSQTTPPASGTGAGKELEEIRASQKEILAKLDNILKEEESVFPQLRKALKAREASEVDYSKVYTIPIGHSPVKGPDTAPIVIAEFSDFQ